MCLYIDNEDDITTLRSGTRRARKQHTCRECRRAIFPGETYHYWVDVTYGELSETKACAHCMATIDLGCALTGCPRAWWWDFIHDHVDEQGFVANVLDDPGHHLSGPDRARMLRRVVQYRRKWRQPDGRLYPLPTVPERVAA